MYRMLKAAALVFAIALGGCALVVQEPGDGRYDGELCTATANGPLNCGTAQVSLSNGRAKLRVSDMTYDLVLEDGQLDLSLVHGTVLVDVFSASYAWKGRFLNFVDTERRVYYRVRFADPPR